MATVSQAAKSLGLQLDKLSGKYYSPSTGKYYDSAAAQQVNTYRNPLFQAAYNNPPPTYAMLYGIPRSNQPTGVLSGQGFQFTPFTGNARGITQGQYSVIDRIINEKPVSASAYRPENILASLFGGFNFSGMPMMASAPTMSTGMDGMYGAGRFLSAPAIQGLIK